MRYWLQLCSLVVSVVLERCGCTEIENKPMSTQERHALKEEARDMFYHAYNAYMENAYPADELMPLSCAGRYRGLGANRGDIDDALGNFSLTLVDTLDTLVVLGDLEEFEHAVRLVIRDVSFDNDIVVSVFETNIRMLGGLISAHLLAEYVQQRIDVMRWYQGELLSMAKELAYRLLPAFNTTTGIPYARINLRHGVDKSDKSEAFRETCTACAGTMILEMAALSRLTGDPIFEAKAQRAMDELWKMRHRSSDLMGSVLNVHSGDWVRRESGVGAGIDSYYEYCLKAYVLLGDDKYLMRFNRHYSAIMKYISHGPMLLDVHMHRPNTNSRNFMDALLAFWPGLQVLKGDIKPAVETHEMLYQVMQRHNFIPEAFTTDFQVHWGQHPLRPEFLESTYFLYKATNDPYYLNVGKRVLKSLQKYARVPCGYAAVNDVRTGKQEDRMDSFVLTETFKYLFLLFVDDDELLLDLNEFVFTTEAHLLPLSLASHANTSKGLADDFDGDEPEFARTCPNSLHLFPESVRKSLKNLVNEVCPRRTKRKLTAAEFQVFNFNHLQLVKDMGINVIAMKDGRIQLLHSFSSAHTTADGEEGMLFMQEMVELSKHQSQNSDAVPQAISFITSDENNLERKIFIQAGSSHFGRELRAGQKLTGFIALAHPFRACTDLTNSERLAGRIVLIERGDCMFVDKARKIQKAGAIAGIVVDNIPGSSSTSSPIFSMFGDGTDDITIPIVFIFTEDAIKLLHAFTQNPKLEVTIEEHKPDYNEEDLKLEKLTQTIQDFLLGQSTPSRTVTVRGLTATINRMQIVITQEKSDTAKPPETTRKIVYLGSFKFVMNEQNDFIVPKSVLRFYYDKAHPNLGDSEDLMTQIKWFLNKLSKELERHQPEELEVYRLRSDILEQMPADDKLLLMELLNAKQQEITESDDLIVNDSRQIRTNPNLNDELIPTPSSVSPKEHTDSEHDDSIVANPQSGSSDKTRVTPNDLFRTDELIPISDSIPSKDQLDSEQIRTEHGDLIVTDPQSNSDRTDSVKSQIAQKHSDFFRTDSDSATTPERTDSDEIVTKRSFTGIKNEL